MQFDERYEEVARLRDGEEVVLRAVRPDDKPLLRAGFERLSPHARYLRFHGVKTDLTDAELAYLTELDGIRHYALGAVRRTGGGEEGLGIARLVQLAGEPGVAEAAITVVDDAQGKGLGKLLFQRIVAAAAERGVERVRCLVLGSNTAMQELLRRISPDARVSVESGVVTIDIPLPAAAGDEVAGAVAETGGLYELVRLAARKVIELRDRLADGDGA